MDFNGLPLLGLPSEATGGIVTSGSQEVPDGTSRRFCELVEVVFPDTSSDEAIARALQAGRAVTEEPEESAPDFSEAGNSTEGLPVVTYDEDTASRHTAQRLNSLRRDSVIPSTPRINSDPSFWEPHVSEDRQRLLLHLKEFGLQPIPSPKRNHNTVAFLSIFAPLPLSSPLPAFRMSISRGWGKMKFSLWYPGCHPKNPGSVNSQSTSFAFRDEAG